MKAFIVSLIFGAGALFCTYLASLGFRGLATSTSRIRRTAWSGFLPHPDRSFRIFPGTCRTGPAAALPETEQHR